MGFMFVRSSRIVRAGLLTGAVLRPLMLHTVGRAETAMISIGDATAPAGDTVMIPVSVNGLAPDHGLQDDDLLLSFDNTILRGVPVAAGENWVTDLVAPIIDNTPGTMRVVGVDTLGETPRPCASDCVLFTLSFEALADGAAAIELVSAHLSDPNGLSPATVDSRSVSGGAVAIGHPPAPASGNGAVIDSPEGRAMTAIWVAGGIALAAVIPMLLGRHRRRAAIAQHFAENKE